MKKADIFSFIKEKFPNENLDIPLKMAIDEAFNEGVSQGEQFNETESWKHMAENEKVRKDSLKKEVDKIKKDIELFNIKFNDFLNAAKEISIIK